MTWKISDFDTCYCGDYRHQHLNGTGRCLLEDLCTPSRCSKFRLVSTAIKIPRPYTTTLPFHTSR